MKWEKINRALLILIPDWEASNKCGRQQILFAALQPGLAVPLPPVPTPACAGKLAWG